MLLLRARKNYHEACRLNGPGESIVLALCVLYTCITMHCSHVGHAAAAETYPSAEHDLLTRADSACQHEWWLRERPVQGKVSTTCFDARQNTH